MADATGCGPGLSKRTSVLMVWPGMTNRANILCAVPGAEQVSVTRVAPIPGPQIAVAVAVLR